jgi:hypothetical protein
MRTTSGRLLSSGWWSKPLPSATSSSSQIALICQQLHKKETETSCSLKLLSTCLFADKLNNLLDRSKQVTSTFTCNNCETTMDRSRCHIVMGRPLPTYGFPRTHEMAWEAGRVTVGALRCGEGLAAVFELFVCVRIVG